MSDRETEFLERWRTERAMYEAWGQYIQSTLSEAVSQAIKPVDLKLFFKMPVSSRVKEEPSLLAKAFHRPEKQYTDPYNDIEDKVGIRVVVLFSEDIEIVEQAINDCKNWTSVKARDFEDERDQNPSVFDYQSKHYIIRSAADIIHNEITITKDTPCEVQVRTILQHAYSELTHDTIYKPNVAAKPDVKRAAAKSMALIEATADYFTQVRNKINDAQAPAVKVEQATDALYLAHFGDTAEKTALNSIIIDHYKQYTDDQYKEKLQDFITGKLYILDRVKERAPNMILYRQPAVLLVYFVVAASPRNGALGSPLSESELSLIYSDLGRSIPRSS